MSKTCRVLATLTVVVFISAAAGAQETVPAAQPPAVDAGWKASYPLAIIDRPLTNPKGMFELRGNTFFTNLSAGSEGKPSGLAPAIYYGVTDTVSVGLYMPVYGICITGPSCGCAQVFNDLGVDVQYYAIRAGKYLLAPHAGFSMSSFQPAMGEFNAAVINWIQPNAWFAIVVEPAISIGLNDRGAAHPDWFNVPLTLGFQVIPSVFLFASTAIGGSLFDLPGSYTVPISAGGWYSFSNTIDIGAEFQFTNLTPHDGSAAADGRRLYLRLALRF